MRRAPCPGRRGPAQEVLLLFSSVFFDIVCQLVEQRRAQQRRGLLREPRAQPVQEPPLFRWQGVWGIHGLSVARRDGRGLHRRERAIKARLRGRPGEARGARAPPEVIDLKSSRSIAG